MRTFFVRCVNIIAIVGLIGMYNAVLTGREQSDEIARLSAELESAKLMQSAAADEQGDSAGYVDGIYSGEAQGFGGPIGVEVTVTDGAITDITITSAEHEDGAYLSMAQDIIPVIIENQSADVDTISGATFSSTGIKNAVMQALEKAEN